MSQSCGSCKNWHPTDLLHDGDYSIRRCSLNDEDGNELFTHRDQGHMCEAWEENR